MTVMTPSSSVKSDPDRGEVHFAIGGLWEISSMKEFLQELSRAAYPMMKAGKRVRVMGDMTEFIPQQREVGDAIRDHLMMSKEHGLERVAIVTTSALMKMQYKRLSEGIQVDFFPTTADALLWLRS